MDETQLLQTAGGLTYRLQDGAGPGAPIILLHGLTGDETVMWTFRPALPSKRMVAAPRAPFACADGGYGWADPAATGLPAYESASRLLGDLVIEIHKGRPILVGFSQGAGMAFAASALQALDPIAIVALSGFLPAVDPHALRGRKVFWAHGLRDERVPIERARGDVARLRSAGVSVEFCESDVGHKVSIDCLRGLKAWLSGIEAGAAGRA